MVRHGDDSQDMYALICILTCRIRSGWLHLSYRQTGAISISGHASEQHATVLTQSKWCITPLMDVK